MSLYNYQSLFVIALRAMLRNGLKKEAKTRQQNETILAALSDNKRIDSKMRKFQIPARRSSIQE